MLDKVVLDKVVLDMWANSHKSTVAQGSRASLGPSSREVLGGRSAELHLAMRDLPSQASDSDDTGRNVTTW